MLRRHDRHLPSTHLVIFARHLLLALFSVFARPAYFACLLADTMSSRARNTLPCSAISSCREALFAAARTLSRHILCHGEEKLVSC